MPQPAKPDRVKFLQGTYRPHRRKPDISGEPTLPECPEWLSELAQTHWHKTIGCLQDLGVALHPADQDCLATYCSLFARQMEAPDKFGPTMVARLLSIWSQFGLTPAARENLGIDIRPKKPNAFE